MKKENVRYMTTLALFCSVLLVLGLTGIGLIPLPVIKATTMHIPVILGAVLLGPSGGAVLGAVFGICSIWSNTTEPNLMSFAFSPFVAASMEGAVSILKSLWIALGCRMLFGYLAGWIWRGCKKYLHRDTLALSITAALSTVLHTLLVLGSIGLLLGEEYAAAKNVAVDAVFGLLMGTVAASGIPEAIAAVVLVTVIGKTLLHLQSARR